MNSIIKLFPDFTQSFDAFWWVFSNGGWVVFVLLSVYILYKMYLLEVQIQYSKSEEWTFLLIKVPRENATSLLAAEQIYAQIHSLQSGNTFYQTYVEGSIDPWYTFEIVSLGGKVSLIMRIPKGMRSNVEAAWYAQYPNIEIEEIEDYLQNVEYEDDGELKIFGTEMVLIKDEVIPIKTFKEFEDTAAEIKRIDPMANAFEVLAQRKPWEFYGIQILARPVSSGDWVGKAEKKVKELIGEDFEEKKNGWADAIKTGLQNYNPINLAKKASESKEDEKKDSGRQNNWLLMTEAEKTRVQAIQKKAGKAGYSCKIRVLYMAPKDQYDGNIKSNFAAMFRPTADEQLNGLKPETTKLWTAVKPYISPSLEAPYIEWEENRRKHHLWNGFKNRSMYVGHEPYILGADELATLFHPPLTEQPISAPVEKVDSKKSQAPINLPIA